MLSELYIQACNDTPLSQIKHVLFVALRLDPLPHFICLLRPTKLLRESKHIVSGNELHLVDSLHIKQPNAHFAECSLLLNDEITVKS